MPGATVSGAPLTQQEEWFRMEPLHGARPKWNHPGRPTLVIEEPRGLGAEATGCMDGLEAMEGGMRVPASQLPLPRQDTSGAGVVTPPRIDADGHGGLRAPGTRLSNKGTRVAPQIFTEPRNKDGGPDRRNVPWSPENVLIDTVARLQWDLADMRAESQFLRTRGSHPLYRPLGMLHSRRPKYHGLQARPTGSSTVKFLTPLYCPMVGMTQWRRCNYSPTWREML